MPSLDCSKPFRSPTGSFRCGQCMPCRIHRAQVWKSRLMLEAGQHRVSLFVTLTYAPEHLPADGKVSVREGQLFLKRLRFLNPGVSIRYFLVGEYGERTARPHYHAVLFGDIAPDTVQKAWQFGFVSVSILNLARAGYIVGYVTAPRKGELRAFCRMSLNPAIGKGVARELGQALQSSASGALAFKALGGDAPVVVRLGGKVHLLGRYLRNVIREELGMEKREPAHKALERQMAPVPPDRRAAAAERANVVSRLVRSKRYL